MLPLSVQLTILASVAVILAAPKATENKLPSCQEFSQGVVFNDSQAIGTWQLLHGGSDRSKDFGPNCVQFTPVTDEERTAISDQIGKYVENLEWKKITLKMKIPCDIKILNLTRDYYLEKLAGDGSYRTLLLPPPSDKLDLAGFHRYPMRLKMIEGQYLAMMDCHEHFIFLLGKQLPEGQQLDERLKKMINLYWPEEL